MQTKSLSGCTGIRQDRTLGESARDKEGHLTV